MVLNVLSSLKLLQLLLCLIKQSTALISMFYYFVAFKKNRVKQILFIFIFPYCSPRRYSFTSVSGQFNLACLQLHNPSGWSTQSFANHSWQWRSPDLQSREPSGGKPTGCWDFCLPRYRHKCLGILTTMCLYCRHQT